jgi:thioredoxin-related protein
MLTNMKTDLHRKTELATNLAIMVVAALLCVVLVKNYLIPKSASTTESIATNKQNQFQAGAKISVAGIDWTQNGQMLLLVLSTTCHFCSESAPFYQQLIKECGGNIRIVAVLPQSVSAGKDYLSRFGISVDDVMQVQFNSLGVRGTPTLIMVDSNGVVTDSWAGKLPNTEEAKVLDRVRQSVAQK